MAAHRRPDSDRLSSALAALWAAGHLAAAGLLGAVIHLQESPNAARSSLVATAPDLPLGEES
jgi:hypothetical protein